MKECVVYHIWSARDDEPPIKNLRSPLVLSIATLRACNPKIPIYVLDSSHPGEDQDFGDLPRKLNFVVVPYTCSLASYEGTPGWRNLSRLFDIESASHNDPCYYRWNIPENVILYNDADVFWMNDPLPLHQDPSKFCFNGWNSGLFYYDKTKIPKKFFEIFKAYAITALNDECFRYITWQYGTPNPEYLVLDEALIAYMWHKHPHLFNKIDTKEHWMASGVDPNNIDVSGLKMIHGNGISVYNKFASVAWKQNYARGLMPLLIKECYDRLISVLDPAHIYSQEEMDYYLPLQVNWSESFLKVLLQCKNQDGLFDLMTAIKQFHGDKHK